MRILRALIDIIKYAIPEKIISYRNIVLKLTGNPFYTAPYITLAEFTLAIDALEAAAVIAENGTPLDKALMHDKEEVADNIYRVTCHYVNQVANGNETKLLSSGFNISKDVPPLPKAILSVVDGEHSGQIRIVIKAVEHARVYICQIHKGGVPLLEADWETLPLATSTVIILDNLAPATYIAVRVSAVTTEATTEFCIPVVKLII